MRFEKAEAPARHRGRAHHQPPGARTKTSSGIPDPQLHSHVVLLAAERKDGRSRRSNPSSSTERPARTARGTAPSLPPTSKSLGLRHRTRTGNGERYFERPRRLGGPVRALVHPRPGRAPRRQPLPPTLRARAPGPESSTASPSPPAAVEDRRDPGGRQRGVASARRGAQPNRAALGGSSSTTGACTTSPRSTSPRSCSPKVTAR